MTLFLSLLIVGNIALYFAYYKQKNLSDQYRMNALDAFSTHEDMKETLRIGLYNRFKRDLDQDKLDNPLLFEYFVAEIMATVRGGRTVVTQGSGDFGVDIEEHAEEGLFIGQVKCYSDQNSVGFDPIAIVHSQMIKQNAVGGYVITTGKFTQNAYTYANGLNIELIDGNTLVNLWLQQLEGKKQHVTELSPAT